MRSGRVNGRNIFPRIACKGKRQGGRLGNGRKA
ncbi:MAG: hypothetical protein ACI4KD_05470 [Oscillospiraceae bacterium]